MTVYTIDRSPDGAQHLTATGIKPETHTELKRIADVYTPGDDDSKTIYHFNNKWTLISFLTANL